MHRLRSSSSSSSDSSSRSGRRWRGPHRPVTIRGNKNPKQHPQDAVDQFWSKFMTKTPGKPTTIIPHNKYAARAAAKAGWTIGTTTQASYEEAAALCRAKVEKIYKECKRVNSKYTDPHFDLELDFRFQCRDSLDSLQNMVSQVESGRQRGRGASSALLESCYKFQPQGVKRVPDIFEKPQFYIDGPTANDVRQGHNLGDCWLMAALCTLSNKPGLIQKICVDQRPDVGVYGFVFHRDGEWFSEIIDDKLYLLRPDYDNEGIERIIWNDREREDPEQAYRKTYQTGSGALYFAQCENQNETWLPLLEKAYSKAHGDYSAIEGGFIGEGIEDLCGGVTAEIYSTDILDRDKFWEELLRVNQDFLFGCSTGLDGRGTGERQGIIESHSYSVMKAVEIDGKRLCLLKNPWGKGEWTGPWSDGSKEWTPEWMEKLNHRFGDDGSFYIEYSDLLRKYQAFDRTRLFGPEWKVASIWTTLNVPWTYDYHDTHFSFILEHSGPVVIVLSQLDDRYFRGLEGQYHFDLSFRVHKAGHKDYVMRSQTGYRFKRSVSVELTLDAGEYIVLVKIDAARNEETLPVEDVVRMNARERREKLTRIGLAYDLAHSKGKIIETEEEKAARKKSKKKRREKDKNELREQIMKSKRGKMTMMMVEYKQNVRRLRRRRQRERTKRQPGMEREREMDMEEDRTDRRRMSMVGSDSRQISGISIAERRKLTGTEGHDNDHKPENFSIDGPIQESTPAPDTGPKGDAEPEAKPEPEPEPEAMPSTAQQGKPASHIGAEQDHPQELPAPECTHTMGTESPNMPGDQPIKTPLESKRGIDRERLMRGHFRDFNPSSHPLSRPEPRELGGGPGSADPATPSPPSSVSSIPDSLLELRLDEQEASQNNSHQDGVHMLNNPNNPAAPIPIFRRGGGGGNEGIDNDESEEDPWNAVVIVGLRVFYDTRGMVVTKPFPPSSSPIRPSSYTSDTKVDVEGDKREEGKDQQDIKDAVKIRVVRTNIWEDSEDDEEDEDDKDSEGGGHDVGRTRQEIPAQGLDVDDSAKDATLKGDTETKKKGIISEVKRANTGL